MLIQNFFKSLTSALTRPVASRRHYSRSQSSDRLELEMLEDRVLMVVNAAASFPTTVAAGGLFDDVVQVFSPGGACTGTLLSTGRHILTAAHCVDRNNDTLPDAGIYTIQFDMLGKTIQLTASPGNVSVPTGWTGVFNQGSDIAIIRLNELAPYFVQRHEIFRASDEIGRTNRQMFMGYGNTNQMDPVTGAVLNGDSGATTGAFGTKRRGWNRIDSVVGLPFFNPQDQYLRFDLDDPSLIQPPFFGAVPGEAICAPGDSGGPLFISGQIAGVCSGGSNPIRFGATADYTRVSVFADWIDATVAGTYQLVLDMNNQLGGNSNDGSIDSIGLSTFGAAGDRKMELLVNGQIYNALVPFSLNDISSIVIRGSNDGETITLDDRLRKLVNIDGGGGGDLLIVRSSSTFLNSQYNIAEDVVIAQTGSLSTVVFHSNLERVTLQANRRDTVRVNGARPETPVSVSGGETITVYAPGVRGRVSVIGFGRTDLTINDDTSSANEFRVNQNVLVSSIGGSGRTTDYAGLRSLTINGGSGGNVFIVSGTPAAPVTLNTGTGADRVFISETSAPLTINGQNGLDEVTIGSFGSVRNIRGTLTVTNADSYSADSNSAVNVDNSADTVARTVIIYANGSYNHISGLIPVGDIVVRGRNLRSLTILAGSGGNTFRIHDTPFSNTPGGLTTTLSTGEGSDQVAVNGTSGALALNVQGGTNSITVGSATTGLDRTRGSVTLRGQDAGAANYVRIDDSASTAGRTYNMTTASFKRVGAFRREIDYQGINLSGLQVIGGSGGNVMRIGGSPAASSVLIQTGAGIDIVDVGSSDAAFGAVNSLRDIRGPLTIDGQAGLDRITFNDQGTTTRQIYTLAANQLTRADGDGLPNMGPISFVGMEAITMLNGHSDYNVVYISGSSAGSTVDVYGMPGSYDVFFVQADHGPFLGPVRVHGQSQGPADYDFAYYYDYANSTPQTYNVRTSPISSDTVLVERLGAAPISFGGLNQVIFYTPFVGGNTTNVQSLPASVFLNMGAGNGDDVTLGSLAPNLVGTLANIKGSVNVSSYGPDGTAVTLVLDDSGNADMTPKNVRLTPPVSPTDLGNHIEGFAPNTVYWRLGTNSSIALLGGAADESFALTSTNFAPAISIDGGGGVNALDYSAYTGDSGLVSWFKGEGNANNSSGGNPGTLNNGVAFADGMVGQAFSFDGVDDYVHVPNSPNLEPSTVSVEAWVNSSVADQPNRYLVAKGANGYVAASYALYTGASGGLSFYVYDRDAGFAVSPSANTEIWDGTWHHVVGTYDGASVRLYIDGAEVGSGTPAIIPLGYGLPDSNDLFIGAYGGPSLFSFSGLIDEPSVYNRGLSATDVQGLFSSGKSALASVGVTVNLPLGTATGLTGGIALIQNVIGSAGNDILVGNDIPVGNGSVLTGGAGRDLLIAGALASILNGGDDEDILIGGTTDYDRNATALLAIMTEWSRTDADYATRVSNLRNGANGLPSMNANTVQSNGGSNTLNGNAGLDFYFANLDLDTLDRDSLTEELIEV